MGDEQEVTAEAAVDNLFGDSSPEPEAQETSTEQAATTGEASEGTETQTQEAPQGQAEQFFAEVAGRKYASKEDFIRSHETLLQKMQRQEQEARGWKQTHDRWGRWDKFLAENPKFYEQVKAAEQRYLAAKAAGATNAQAKQAAQSPQSLPPEVQQKLAVVDKLQEYVNRQEQREADQTLQAELQAVRTQYKLDDATMNKVTGIMLEVAQKTGLEVSAEWAYRDLRAREANAQLVKTQVELKRVKASDSSPTGTSGAPSKGRKIEDLKRGEEEGAISAWLDKMGVKETD